MAIRVMKNISIITGSDLRMVMGVNYFIKSFIQCNDYFKDVKVNRVYSSIQTLKVDEGDQMPIGLDLGTMEYKSRRFVRIFLRKLLTDKFYPFALFKYTLNLRSVSRNSVERFIADNVPCDYIIFQEIGCAEYYFKHYADHPKTKGVKTMLVIHSEDDTGSMLMETFHGYGRKDMQRRYDEMRDFVYSRIDKVMYISKKAYNASIMPEGKKVFVYNGSPNIEYNITEKNSSKTQFVCVGSIEGRKGQDKILEALSLMDKDHIDRLHVTFVGSGTKEKITKQMAIDLGVQDSVTFMGRRNDVPEILKDMDVFVMPSTVEGLPMSAIEAMRAGLFLILTDTGGNAELCEEGCGVVCERTPKDIARKMYNAIDGYYDISLSQRRGSRNRFISAFSLEGMAKGYEKELLIL